MNRSRATSSLFLGMTLLCTALIAMLVASRAGAVTDAELLSKFGDEGAGAGQTLRPTGMASDPATGHLYVADPGNNRLDEFTAWGQFIKSWGWGVADGAARLETCTASCQQGIRGTGSGQFASPLAVAVDQSGAIYVLDILNLRIEKFGPGGDFLLMFGGGVDKTTGGNVCTAASGDECGPGSEGSGPSDLGFEDLAPVALAIGSDGTIYVGGKERIQEFEPTGAFKAQFSTGGFVNSIAVGPGSGTIYATYRAEDSGHVFDDDVRRFDSSGIELTPIPIAEPAALATDATGNLYVLKEKVFFEGEPQRVVEFDPSGAEVSSCCSPPLIPGQGPEGKRYSLLGLTLNSAGDLYVSNRSDNLEGNFVTAYGPAPLMYGPPPPAPPSISRQLVTSVGRADATVKAMINPQFWPDTRFYVEYGLEPCSVASCSKEPVPPGAALGGGAVDESVTTNPVALSGLTADTTYHFRFVAESSGGGPSVGTDHTFKTFGPEEAQETCPSNEAFRVGPSASLPDCRAYELVSPVDKEGGDILALPDVTGYETRLNQASADGNSITYSSYRAFGGAAGSAWTSQYLARRGAAGWESEVLTGSLVGDFYGTSLLENPFKAFSRDLCQAWTAPGGEPILAPGAVAGFPNLYRREGCSGSSYEALTTVRPASAEPGNYIPELQGMSADGATALLRVQDRLTEDVPIFCQDTIGRSGPTLSYQWLRNGSPIAGATSAKYLPVAADDGATIQCQQTIIEGGIGAIQITNPAIGIPPTPTVLPPSLAGQGQGTTNLPAPSASEPLAVGGPAGQTLTCDSGAVEWNGTPTFAFRWYRNAVPIAGAEASTYQVSEDDLAAPATFQCEILASNAGGTMAATSASVEVDLGPNPEMPSATTLSSRVYEASGGNLKNVCVFPEGTSAKVEAELPDCSAGTSPVADGTTQHGRFAAVSHAISEDGSRVYWSASHGPTLPGRIYLRLNGSTTVKVSETQTTKEARFWGASPDGERALFEVENVETAKNENLYLYDLQEEESSLIADHVTGVVATSEDLSHIFFVSTEVLPDAGGGVAGKPNLYVYDGEGDSFIATLSTRDVKVGSPFSVSDTSEVPIYHVGEATPSGSRLVFVSTNSLTGFDNSDAISGEPDSEVYTYDVAARQLHCASCSPAGANPQGRQIGAQANGTSLWTAAAIPAGETQFFRPRSLASDGSRLFFTSYTALLPEDRNQAADVYEWEVPGSSSCSTQSNHYFASAGGCLFLISSGQSEQDSELVDSDPTGRDVFFATQQSLLPQDAGALDIYDAREDGGFPGPVPRAAPCEGQACQGSAPAPPPPASPRSGAAGPGNGPQSKVCPKGAKRSKKKGRTNCRKTKKKSRTKKRSKTKKHKSHKTKKHMSQTDNARGAQ